jgi:hypothetical protein
VPAPRLYTIPSDQPNAFATGRNPQHAAVAVTEGLVHHLPPDQVESVLAHEFAHIKNRDILVSSIAAMVAGAIAAIANIFQFSLLFGGEDEDAGPLGWIGLLATIRWSAAHKRSRSGSTRQRRRSTPSTHWHDTVWRPSSRRIHRSPSAYAGCGRSTTIRPSASPHRVVA